MGRWIIKPVLDEDFYVIWTSYTDLPVAWGSRKWLKKYLNTPRRGEVWERKDEIKAKLAKIDETGTSGYRTRENIRVSAHWEVPLPHVREFIRIWKRHEFKSDFRHPDYAAVLTDFGDD